MKLLVTKFSDVKGHWIILLEHRRMVSAPGLFALVLVVLGIILPCRKSTQVSAIELNTNLVALFHVITYPARSLLDNFSNTGWGLTVHAFTKNLVGTTRMRPT